MLSNQLQFHNHDFDECGAGCAGKGDILSWHFLTWSVLCPAGCRISETCSWDISSFLWNLLCPVSCQKWREGKCCVTFLTLSALDMLHWMVLSWDLCCYCRTPGGIPDLCPLPVHGTHAWDNLGCWWDISPRRVPLFRVELVCCCSCESPDSVPETSFSH